MNEIICPNCKKAFKVDEAGFADILKQVRDHQFEEELQKRLKLAEIEKEGAVKLVEANFKNALQENLSKKDIERYLDKMPVGYRQIFMLVVIDEYPHTEVAKILGISPETSRSQLSRAKAWLRKNVLNNTQKSFVNGF